jgi:hypothetical protein
VVAHVALVSETPRLALSEALQVGAAIQKQVTEDFGPGWEIEGAVDAFYQLAHVPLGYYPVVVRRRKGDRSVGKGLPARPLRKGRSRCPVISSGSRCGPGRDRLLADSYAPAREAYSVTSTSSVAPRPPRRVQGGGGQVGTGGGPRGQLPWRRGHDTRAA